MDLSGLEGDEPRVLYEDSSLVAVYKPPRMHSAPGLGEGDLCAWTFERYPLARLDEVSGLKSRRGPPAEGGLLHRLDYETSGLVLFALKPEAYFKLLEQQRLGLFRKEYLALASVSTALQPVGSKPSEGLPSAVDPGLWSAARRSGDAGALSALIEATAGPPGRASPGGASPGGASPGVSCAFRPFGPGAARVACLSLPRGRGGRILSLYHSAFLGSKLCPGAAGSETGILELRLGISRGFRHQIRAQLAWVGLPILGDELYGGEADGRLRLYAVALSFTHPETGKALGLAIP